MLFRSNRLAPLLRENIFPPPDTRQNPGPTPMRRAGLNCARRRGNLCGGAAQRRRGYFAQYRLIYRADRRILPPPAFNKSGILGILREMFLNATTLIGIQNTVHEGVKIRFLEKSGWRRCHSRTKLFDDSQMSRGARCANLNDAT